MEQTEAVDKGGLWTEEDPHWLISVWGGSSSLKLQAIQIGQIMKILYFPKLFFFFPLTGLLGLVGTL